MDAIAARATAEPMMLELIFTLKVQILVLIYHPPLLRLYRQVRCGKKQGFCLESHGGAAGMIQPRPGRADATG